jgi:triacylglycerol esterase/lipase EstA (alpha/beta hydrolase family)
MKLLEHLLVLGAATFVCSGCAVVQTRVQTQNRAETAALREVGDPTRSATQWLDYAQRGKHASEAERLAAWVEAARAALPEAAAGDAVARKQYRAAVRQVVNIWAQSNGELQPAAEVAGAVRLELDQGPEDAGLIDVRQMDFVIPADQLEFQGLPERELREGLGLPLVAWAGENSEVVRGEPGVTEAGMALPVTAVLRFGPEGKSGKGVWSERGPVARLSFVRTFQRDKISVGQREVELAADFSAPLAWMIAQGRNRVMDVVSLFFPLPRTEAIRLVQLQPFDPDKIPVVLVHGLISRPEAWRAAVNTLQADPVVRKHYQFWLFSYPTGLPVTASAAGLRKELDRFNAELEERADTPQRRAALRSKVLVGHSMGGLLSNLQIREGGNRLWRQIAPMNLEDVPVGEATRKRMLQMLDFRPREDVSRVIFMATPHRGSPLALRPAARFFAARIRFAVPEFQEVRGLLVGKMHESFRRELGQPANSIRFLRANSPLLEAILQLPRNERVRLHSIIGDRGRGDGENSSDGIVPYWSSHLPGVESELLVPSGHEVNESAEGIAELRRILHQR